MFFRLSAECSTIELIANWNYFISHGKYPFNKHTTQNLSIQKNRNVYSLQRLNTTFNHINSQSRNCFGCERNNHKNCFGFCLKAFISLLYLCFTSFSVIKMAAIRGYAPRTSLRQRVRLLLLYMAKIGFLEGFHEKCVLHLLRSRTLNLPLSRAGILLLNYIRIYLQGKSIRSDPIQTFLTSFVK